MLRMLQSEGSIAPYVRICGVIALTLAVGAVLMPTIGVLDIIPITIILGIVTLYGGFRGVGAGILVMCAMNLIVSPAFWANIELTPKPFTRLDHTLAYFDLVGIIAMSALFFSPNRFRKR